MSGNADVALTILPMFLEDCDDVLDVDKALRKACEFAGDA
jgi:hypothetical protein